MWYAWHIIYFHLHFWMLAINSMLLGHYFHPSVIIWSIGNNIIKVMVSQRVMSGQQNGKLLEGVEFIVLITLAKGIVKLMKTLCNPVNLEYQFQHFGKSAHREAADPTLILFKGIYYLFASMSAGFYYSEDLIEWKYHENRNLMIYQYAPDVRQVGTYLVFCASSQKNSGFYRTLDPMSDVFEKVSEPFPFWDPDIFQDDDGKVYFYWGSGKEQPIYGIELDPDTLIPISERQEVIVCKPYEHGFEYLNYPGKENRQNFLTKIIMKFIEKGTDPNAPYMEGAFMTKISGRYYLQYAAPATELPVYADGVYVGVSPLGPFQYQKHNPFSLRTSGFITSAGHGSTIEDKYGNLWHASTMRISVNAQFERRIGLFPAGIDEDGILYCNQNFADYPYEIPEGKVDTRTLKPKWMLLSYKKPAVASSCLKGHDVLKAVNENICDWWCAKGSKGEWFQVDLQDICQVFVVQINFADERIPVLKKAKEERSDTILTNYRYIDSGAGLKTRYLLEGSVDGKSWIVLEDKTQAETSLANDYITFQTGVLVRFVKITSYELPYSQKFALSGFRLFGKGIGQKPARVQNIVARRKDDLTGAVKWEKVAGAIGYNVRFGAAQDKLYSSYQLYEQNEVMITVLNKGYACYVCVDSYNENGITEGIIVRMN